MGIIFSFAAGVIMTSAVALLLLKREKRVQAGLRCVAGRTDEGLYLNGSGKMTDTVIFMPFKRMGKEWEKFR